MIQKFTSLAIAAVFAMSCAANTSQIQESPEKTATVPADTTAEITQIVVPDAEELLDQSKIHYSNALLAVYDNDTTSARYEFEMALEALRTVQDLSTLEPWTDDEARLLTQKLTEDFVRYVEQGGNDGEEYQPSSLQEQISLLEPIEEIEGAAGTFQVLDDREGHVPIIKNYRVDRIIEFFKTRGRNDFSIWLNRIHRYEGMMKEILRSYDLPPELFYLALIESGLNPRAYSYAHAAGQWQFISSTGSMYGLDRNWWVDERRDPVKATHAAAQYLKDLYEEFGDWYLAMAAYNAGERRVWRAIRREGTRDFWALRTLPRQTRNYVPTFLAGTIIAHHPEEYGFYPEPEPAYAVDTVTVHKSLDLYKIAAVLGITAEDLKDLNPELRKNMTPGNTSYELKLPMNSRDRFLASIDDIPEADEVRYKEHYVRRGQTLSYIASLYGVSVGSVMRANNLRSSHWIKAGQMLTIPVSANYTPSRSYSSSSSSSTRSVPQNIEGHVKLSYLVKSGDTLGEIAEIYGTRASNIRYWNGLRYGQYIYPGNRLNIWVPEGSAFASVASNTGSQGGETSSSASEDGDYQIYVVQSGDTLWDIARRHGVELQALRSWNMDVASGDIKPGDRIRIAVN